MGGGGRGYMTGFRAGDAGGAGERAGMTLYVPVLCQTNDQVTFVKELNVQSGGAAVKLC